MHTASSWPRDSLPLVLILLSLVATHYCSSDIYEETLVVFLLYYSWIYIPFEFIFKQLKTSEYQVFLVFKNINYVGMIIQCASINFANQ